MGSYIKEAPSVMGSGFFYGSLDFLLFLEVVKAVKGSCFFFLEKIPISLR
jgi:hypothetical protein